MISPLAHIEEGAQLGKNCRIGPFCHIGKQVILGDECSVDSHSVICGQTTLGSHNHIYSHAIIGSEPQDLKFAGEKTSLEVGSHNKIRECVTINVGTDGGGSVTRIGSHNLIMAYAHIAHDCQLGDAIIMANSATLAGHVEVANNAIISAQVCIHQFVRIGTLAMAAGGSMVSQDIPPFAMVHGDRAVLRGLNFVGLKRAEFSNETIAELKQIYKLFFRSHLTIIEATEQLQTLKSQEASTLVDFISRSERGLCREK